MIGLIRPLNESGQKLLSSQRPLRLERPQGAGVRKTNPHSRNALF